MDRYTATPRGSKSSNTFTKGKASGCCWDEWSLGLARIWMAGRMAGKSFLTKASRAGTQKRLNSYGCDNHVDRRYHSTS